MHARYTRSAFPGFLPTSMDTRISSTSETTVHTCTLHTRRPALADISGTVAWPHVCARCWSRMGAASWISLAPRLSCESVSRPQPTPASPTRISGCDKIRVSKRRREALGHTHYRDGELRLFTGLSHYLVLIVGPSWRELVLGIQDLSLWRTDRLEAPVSPPPAVSYLRYPKPKTQTPELARAWRIQVCI